MSVNLSDFTLHGFLKFSSKVINAGGLFIAVGDSSSPKYPQGAVFSTDKGQQWTQRTFSGQATTTIAGLVKTDSTYVAFPQGSSGSTATKPDVSTDGVTWTNGVYIPTGQSNITQVVWTGGSLVGVKYNTIQSSARLSESASNDVSAPWVDGSVAYSGSVNRLVYNGSVYILAAGSFLKSTAGPNSPSVSVANFNTFYDGVNGSGSDFLMVGGRTTFLTPGYIGFIDGGGSAFIPAWSPIMHQGTTDGSNIVFVGAQGSLGVIMQSTVAASTARFLRTDDGTFPAINSVAYGYSTFVAACDSGVIVTSKDGGMSWSRSYNSSGNFISVIFDGSRFIASSTNGNMYYSTNGTLWNHWITYSSFYGGSLRLAYAAGSYVATGDTANSIYTSGNGTTWTHIVTTQTSSFTPGKGLAISSDGSTIVVSAATGATGIRSINSGSTWGNIVFNGSGTANSVSYCNGYFIACLNASNQTRYSSLGSSYSATGSGGSLASINPSAAVGAGGSFYVAGNAYRYNMAYSMTDIGICGTPGGVYTVTTPSLLGVAYDGSTGQYIVCGQGGYIGYYNTSTGLWPVAKTGTTQDLYGVACQNNAYVAVGNNGTIVSSLGNLRSWKARTTGITTKLTRVIAG